MNPHIESINDFSSAWASLIWAVVWQSTLLIGVCAGACRLLQHSSPAMRFWICLIVCGKLLILPFWAVGVSLPVSFQSASTEDLEEARMALSEQGPVVGNPLRFQVSSTGGSVAPATAGAETALPWYRQLTWQAWLLLAWAVIVLSQVGRLLRQRFRLQGLLRSARPATDPALLAELQELSATIGLRRPPAIVTTEHDCSPFACRLGRPTIVLPRRLLNELDISQRRFVLLHELAHIKRHDLLWGWIPEIARIVYFFHPAVHWLLYRTRLERELACDQLALANGGSDAAGYAATLVHVLSHASEPAVLRAAAVSTAGLTGGVALPNEDKPHPETHP